MIGTDHSNAIEAQIVRVLDAIRSGPKSTIELRRDYDVMMPAARVHQLRGMGYSIDTQRTREPTDCGKLHTVARYVLLASPGSNALN